jgi:uncharacterized iron-regulated protein
MGTKSERYLIMVIWLLSLIAFTGCSSMRPRPSPFVRIEGSSENFREGQIIDAKSAAVISFNDLIRRLASKDLVFIGEVHDNPEHHLIQVQILRTLMAKHGAWDVAAEFFEKNQQPFIDKYLGGSIVEKEFLDLIEWRKKWSFDYSLYRPLILEAKYSGNRIVAINAPGHIVRKIARTGLESLSLDERNQIAEHIDLDDVNHREYLLEAYKIHKHRDLKKFDFFYQAQCVWEDTMAESIASHIKGHGRKIVVFSGNGHIIYKFGIPNRSYRRARTSFATLILQPAASTATISRDAGDFIWLTGHCGRGPHFVRNRR